MLLNFIRLNTERRFDSNISVYLTNEQGQSVEDNEIEIKQSSLSFARFVDRYLTLTFSPRKNETRRLFLRFQDSQGAFVDIPIQAESRISSLVAEYPILNAGGTEVGEITFKRIKLRNTSSKVLKLSLSIAEAPAVSA